MFKLTILLLFIFYFGNLNTAILRPNHYANEAQPVEQLVDTNEDTGLELTFSANPGQNSHHLSNRRTYRRFIAAHNVHKNHFQIIPIAQQIFQRTSSLRTDGQYLPRPVVRQILVVSQQKEYQPEYKPQLKQVYMEPKQEVTMDDTLVPPLSQGKKAVQPEYRSNEELVIRVIKPKQQGQAVYRPKLRYVTEQEKESENEAVVNGDQLDHQTKEEYQPIVEVSKHVKLAEIIERKPKPHVDYVSNLETPVINKGTSDNDDAITNNNIVKSSPEEEENNEDEDIVKYGNGNNDDITDNVDDGLDGGVDDGVNDGLDDSTLDSSNPDIGFDDHASEKRETTVRNNRGSGGYHYKIDAQNSHRKSEVRMLVGTQIARPSIKHFVTKY